LRLVYSHTHSSNELKHLDEKASSQSSDLHLNLKEGSFNHNSQSTTPVKLNLKQSNPDNESMSEQHAILAMESEDDLLHPSSLTPQLQNIPQQVIGMDLQDTHNARKEGLPGKKLSKTPVRYTSPSQRSNSNSAITQRRSVLRNQRPNNFLEIDASKMSVQQHKLLGDRANPQNTSAAPININMNNLDLDGTNTIAEETLRSLEAPESQSKIIEEMQATLYYT